VNTKRMALCTALGIVLLVSACSSSKKASSSTSTGSSSPSTSLPSTGAASNHATATPIKVGVICTCSGTFGAALADVEDVYKAWANTVNSSGGVNTHPIQLITEDDAGVPATAVADAQTLVSDHVDAIADISNVDEPWASTVQAANIPVVGVQETNAPFQTNPDFYPEGETLTASYQADLEIAKSAGLTNMGVLYCAEAPSCTEEVALFRNVSPHVGVPIAYSSEIAYTAPNYTAQCLAAKQAHIQSLFIGDAPAILARVGSDCSRQGYTPTYVTAGQVFNASLLTAPGLRNSNWLGYPTLPYWYSTPATSAMTAAVQKYYPGLTNNTTNFTEVAAEAWPSGLLLADAVKAGGLTSSDTPSANEIVQGLAALKGDTLDGWAPPLTFTPNQPHTTDCWFTAHVQAGKIAITNNGKPSCPSGSAS
jgi:branched-chain amino acid transport system substrate-binding protein